MLKGTLREQRGGQQRTMSPITLSVLPSSQRGRTCSQENSLDPEIDSMVGTLQESPSKSLPPSDYGGEG